MKDLNRVELIGRLGQDPEVQCNDHGTARATFSVATSRHWTDADGQAQTITEWTWCTAWSKLAEIAAQFLSKGSRVYVQGRLHTSRWTDDQNGAPRSSVEIVLDDLILLDSPTPAVALEDGEEVRETQPTPSTPPSARRPATQQPIRPPAQPVHLRDTPAQPSKRRHKDI